jgi:hypothetical protein
MADSEKLPDPRYAAVTEALLRKASEQLDVPYEQLTAELPLSDPEITARHRNLMFPARRLFGLDRPWINPVKDPSE